MEAEILSRKQWIMALFVKILPILAFAIPMIILYHWFPTSFEATWKGRTYYLFFMWLIALETIMAWDDLRTHKLKSRLRTVLFVLALSLPTLVVIASNVYNVDPAISTSALQAGVPSSNIGWFWLATEYLILTILFALTILIQYGVEGLGEYAISILFLGTIGGIYTIDNLYPFESFTPFQIIVPTTTMLAIGMLNFMGYHTLWVRTTNNMPLLIAESPQGKFSPGLWIAWPCSGVESLIIYTITMSLFLKKSGTSWIFKIASFSLGAVVTYLINGFRIATIFMIAADGGNWRYFHDYYGQLYSITWILCYPLIIIGALSIWRMIKYRRLAASQNNLNPQVKGIIQA